MVRQAHSYLFGAVSSTVLIVSAVVAFVLLVSVQAFRDWPVSGLEGGDRTVSVSSDRAPSAGPAPTLARAPAAETTGGAASGHAAGGAPVPGRSGSIAQRGGLGGGNPGATAPHGATPPGGPGLPSGGGSSPTGSAPAPASGGGSGSPGPGGGAGGGAGSSSSASVTGTVNDTVSKVDETLGGTGVAKVTEGVVDGVAGPESTVGHAVDETAGTVGGLLHLHR